MKDLNKLKSNRAITLIALIITIIILLILATITVNVAIDDGLFTKAQDAVDKTNDKVENTQNRIDELTGILDDLEEKPKIGDYVNYEPEIDTYEVTTDVSGHSEVQNFTTQTGTDSLRWRIMSLGDDNGNILLVADRPTTDELTLNGGVGYTHSTNLIEGICSELYDNQTLGVTARSYNYYSDVLTGITNDVLTNHVEGGDRFPYLGTKAFWIPVSWREKIGTAVDNMWICYYMNNVCNVEALAFGYVRSYSLLPVIMVPVNEWSLSYVGADTNDANWNIWNL